jgi:hypothetical protein
MQDAPSANAKPVRRRARAATLIDFLPASSSLARKLRQPDAVRNSGGQDGRRATDHDSGIGRVNFAALRQD